MNSPYPKTVQQLRECPFCGDTGPEVTGERGLIWVACTAGTECLSRGPKSYTEAEAIEAWNTRALSALESPTPTGEVGEMLHRLRGHALGLAVNERYDPAKQSGLTNADAVSYSKFLTEVADLIERLSRPPTPEASDLLARIGALYAKATPGEWRVGPYYTREGTPDELVRGMLFDSDEWPTGVIDENDPPLSDESLSYNLDFTAAVHNAWPAIADLITRLSLSGEGSGAGSMRKALEPFAQALKDWGDDAGHHDNLLIWEHPLAQNITVGDVRRASAALAHPDTNGGDHGK